MYIMQICNVYSQEILREAAYDKPDFILEMIESAEKNVKDKLDAFILDKDMRTLKAEYVNCKKIQDEDDTIYKLFFKTRLSEIQAKIR
ncbi:hypothetical protein [Neobacillus mesonae]|uniref:hypothetical protein n=1 Tax=Neobacillus mesonae TaxID=1193713 RepID=UPI002572E643|nr:hypothetical protein [Neobacillus mesonae]